MPYTAATAISFAQRQSGRYGDGECWTLVEAAIVGAVGGRLEALLHYPPRGSLSTDRTT